MTDVTPSFHEYRECIRFLWNNFLRVRVKSDTDFDALDRFSCLSATLFEELVLRPLGRSGFRRQRDEDPYLCFVLASTIDDFPVMVARGGAARGYWDDPITRLNSNGTIMKFIGFFDWDRFHYIDLQYYRARIVKCDEHGELVGRDALVEVQHAGVLFDAEANSE